MDQRLRRLVTGTTGLTFLLLLLGVYTAGSGAGLTCSARWPLCNGAVFGLFPANWPSFVEWFHRLVAAVTGAFILGSTVAAWRRGASLRVRAALTVAVVFLPAQIALGALTVTRYAWLILAAHFVTALVIFTGLVLATLWGLQTSGDSPDHTGQGRVAGTTASRAASLAAAIGVVALVPTALLTPRVLFVYGAAVQVAYYAAGLSAYSALLAVAVWTSGRPRARPRRLASGAAALVFALLVLGRQTYGDPLEVASLLGTALAVVLAVGVAVDLHGRSGAGSVRLGLLGGD